MSYRPIAYSLLAMALFAFPDVARANQGIDTASGSDLPINSAGTLKMTVCGAAGETKCPNPGYIVFGNDPTTLANGWIDPASGNSSFGGVPSGAVMSFNLVACPTGWTSLAEANGRTIIGTGNSGATGATNHALGQVGGEETHTLMIAEIPSHSHSIFAAGPVNENPGSANFSAPYAANWGWSNQSEYNYVIAATSSSPSWGLTSKEGGDQPHNMMIPYLSLLYCQKN